VQLGLDVFVEDLNCPLGLGVVHEALGWLNMELVTERAKLSTELTAVVGAKKTRRAVLAPDTLE
jgi:hypothetical protein